MQLFQSLLCVVALKLVVAYVASPPVIKSLPPLPVSESVDFAVITEDGLLLGFDSCGNPLWVWSLGRRLLNATESDDASLVSGARMVPAIDGSLYVVFPAGNSGEDARIAHVNATIMSVVAESPFSTPAFPNSYLTGSKVQSVESVSFDDSFSGWATVRMEKYFGRKLLFALNDWTLSCIESSSQRQKWGLSFVEFSPLTQTHLFEENIEFAQVSKLAKEIEISTTSTLNRVTKKLDSKNTACKAGASEKQLHFDSRVAGVYAVLDPPDTGGNLVLVLVGANAPIPVWSSSFSQLPEPVSGFRIEYASGIPTQQEYRDSWNFQLAVGSVTPYRNWPAVRASGYIALIDYAGQQPERILAELRVVDILRLKFFHLSTGMKFYVIAICCLAIYIVRKVYLWMARYGSRKSESSGGLAIVLPDGTELRQRIGGLYSDHPSMTTMTISSPASSSNRLVLIPSEAIQPYEVIKVGQSDSVEFQAWQNLDDISAFDKKIKDISQRTAKLPFTHSAASRRPSLDTGNATVLFLGRNVDEPKLVFRNPRAETELQRPNIPLYTQSIRNAVVSSAIRDCASIRAYVPRSLIGNWNTFQGVFQEYVKKNSSSSVSIASLGEAPQSAVDTAFLILLVRDTDAHDGNYVRDLRRKIALFDLGCCLADRPLPNDAVDRMALDNFEIWRRAPHLLDTAFEERHVEFLKKIHWDALNSIWTAFEYQEPLVELARLGHSRLVHPTTMLRIMRMHANFLLACASHGRTVLFAANLMYDGSYDDLWIQCGGDDDIDTFEAALIAAVL